MQKRTKHRVSKKPKTINGELQKVLGRVPGRMEALDNIYQGRPPAKIQKGLHYLLNSFSEKSGCGLIQS